MNNDLFAASESASDLSVDLDTPPTEPFEWPLQAPGQELFLDIPPVFNDQTTGLGQYSSVQFISEGCYCSAGVSCGRHASSTYSFVARRQVQNTRPQLLRLRLLEAWELPNDPECEGYYPIHLQGRPSAFDLGRPTFRGFVSSEVRYCCSNDCFILDIRGDKRGAPWLLHAQQAQDRGLRYVRYAQTNSSVIATYRVADPVQWVRFGYQLHHRLVEYEFANYTAVQAPATLHPWACELLQDLVGPDSYETLKYLSDPEFRGFLRLLRW